MSEREQLEQAIAALEAQRAILGDAVVDVAVAPMREKLAALAAAASRETQQRKQVTVLFADVSGFTAMSETLDAEEVSATMNALWARLDGAILQQGGRIDKHIGDAVMALFGAPTAREDDPERAIRAALAMQQEIRTFMPDAQGQPRLQMRIGINTGPVLLGAVGTTGEYTAMGDTVNLASRLEHAAPVGGILISHDTYRHVRGVFDVQPLEPITVKGKAEPVQVYVVRAAKPKAFRVTTRGVEGVETRTIGRETELQQMQAAFTRARQEQHAHLISVVAEAGTGKSRLLYEFHNWMELQPYRTRLFRGRATSEMRQLPYALFRDVLASRFDIQDSDPTAAARRKLELGITGLAGPDQPEAAMWAHFVGHLIGLDFSASPHLQGILADAQQIRDRAFYYVAQFLAAIAAQDPVALLLEDIHWADNESLDLFQHVLQANPRLPLVVVGLARPSLFEHRPEWGQGPVTHLRVDLHPLSEADSRRLVAEILRKLPAIPETLTRLIVERAGGSPFYMEELIKMLIEDRVIVRGEEAWHVAEERLAEVRVPPTLTGILQARLDGLPAPEREALQQASVVGRVFWSGVVQRMHHPDAAPQPAPAVGELFGTLTGKELIFHHEPSVFADTSEYIFKHALLHDVTYESVLKRLRRAYHAQVAESLIALGGERSSEYAGRIAEHFERAEKWAEAAEWYGRAGKQAQAAFAPEGAIAYYRKALKFWQEVPNLSETQTARLLAAYDGLGEMLVSQARYGEAIDTFLTLRARAEAAGNAPLQARALYALARAQVRQGDNRAALESAAQAEAVARSAGLGLELALALWVKGLSLFRLGDTEATLALGEQMLTLVTELGDRRQRASTLNLLGGVHHALGRYEQAQGCWEEALSIWEELDDRRQISDLANNLGLIATARGDHHAAFERYQAALEQARDTGDRDGELVFLNNVGAARVALGDDAAAEVHLRRVIELAGESGSWILADTYRALAEACQGQGKTAAALEAARQALALSRSGGVPEYLAAAWRALGQAAADVSAPAHVEGQGYDAAACFAESLRICTEMRMEGERAQTLRAWARHEMQQGHPERGAALWREARDLFAQLGATLEAERMAALPAASR